MTPTIEDVFNKHFKPAKQFGMADKDISRIKAAMTEWEQIQNKVKDERIKELEYDKTIREAGRQNKR